MAKRCDFSTANLNLQELLHLYEMQEVDIPKRDSDLERNDIKTIEVDTSRNFPFYSDLNDTEKMLFKKELKKMLISLPFEYVQSMCDIVAVLMYFYYSEEKRKSTLINLSDRENTVSIIEMDAAKPIQKLYSDATHDRMVKNICKILKYKYVPLIEDQFKKYLENNSIFIKMMEKRGVHMPTSKSLVYTNTTLTWFSRSIEDINDIYKIFSLIISCPMNVVFLLLVHYFDYIENGKKITVRINELMPHVLELEKEFVEIQRGENENTRPKRAIIYGVATGVIVAGAIMFGIFKRFK